MATFTKDQYEYWLSKPLYSEMEVIENEDQRWALYLAIERCVFDPYHQQYLRGIVTYNNNDMNGGN